MVVVEKAVDAFVIAQRIESLVYIRYGVLDVSVSAVFHADLPECFQSCMVVVEKAVDAFVIAQRIESLVYIRYGVQYNVVLPVQFRIIPARPIPDNLGSSLVSMSKRRGSP